MKNLKFILILCLLILINIINGESGSHSTNNNETSIESSGETTTISSSENITYTNYTCTENETCKSEIELCVKVFGDKSSSDRNNNGCDCNKNNDTISTTSKPTNSTNCISRDSLNVKLSPKTINSWTDGEKGSFTQFEITIENNQDKNIKQIYIGYDDSLSLRDDKSIWNLVFSESKDKTLILPQYQQTINSMSNYSFGYIISGTTPANLIINEIVIE